MSVNINILVYSYLQIWAGQNIMLTLLKKTFKLSFILLSLFWIRIVRDIKMVDIQEVNVDCVSKRCWRADEQVIIIMNNLYLYHAESKNIQHWFFKASYFCHTCYGQRKQNTQKSFPQWQSLNWLFKNEASNNETSITWMITSWNVELYVVCLIP